MNKPRYSLRRNFGYALAGFAHVFRHETVFKIETAAFVVFSAVAWRLPVGRCEHLWLQVSLFLPLLAELFNSAVERTVDLATQKEHPLAKAAKDSAAAGCLLAVVMTATVWGIVLMDLL